MIKPGGWGVLSGVVVLFSACGTKPPADPCTPNPCLAPHRTTCEVSAGAALCRCDPAYAPEGDGCTAAPVWNCDAQHASGDGAEPDECPALAKALAVDTDAPRSLGPEGDHDWLSLAVTPGRLFSFTATSATVGLLVEIFDVGGTVLLASDNRGASHAEVTFAASSTVVMVRVRGVRANDVGDYVARYADVGLDDYVNEPSGAVTLVPAAGAFSGQVQYAGDLDVVWLEVPAHTAVRFDGPDGGPSDLVLVISRPDGGARTRGLGAGEFTSVTTPTVESLVLTARGRNPRDLGAFHFELTSLGPDDHADDPAFGTPLPPGSMRSGVLERPEDVDSFRVTQTVDHLYLARWQGGAELSISALDATGNLLASAGSDSNGGLVWQATDSEPGALRVEENANFGVHGSTYSLSAEDLGVDDHGDTLDHPTPLTLATLTAGRLELPGDLDTFSFDATAGHVFQVTLGAAAGNNALTIQVFDPAGRLLGTGTPLVSVLCATAGTYAVQVGRGYSSGVQPYSLTVVDRGVDDHGNTALAATALTLATATAGDLQYGADVDAFRFTAQAGHVYQATCTASPSAFACGLTVRDPSGAKSAGSGSEDSLRFLAPSGGAWVVEVTASFGPSPLGPYTLTVIDQGVDDHSNTEVGATPLPLDTPLNGSIQYTLDLDLFVMPVVGGHHHQVGCGASCSVSVKLPDGTTLPRYDLGPNLAFKAPVTATRVFVTITGGPGTTYAVRGVDLGADDHGDDRADATSLTDGVTTTGVLETSSDVDAFLFTAASGDVRSLACTTTSGTACALEVSAPSGNLLLQTTQAATQTTGFIATSAGRWLVTVKGNGSTYGTGGSYELTVARGSDDATTTRPLALGTSANGAIDYMGDTDTFSVQLTANTPVQLRSSPRTLVTVTDPGNMSDSFYGSAASATFTPTTSGLYRFVVEASSQSYGTFPYTLLVE